MSRAASQEPLDRMQEHSAPARRPLQRVRAAGVLLAWLAAVACGWKVAQEADLLSAVLRGAAAWLGLMVVWLAGIAVCERLILSARPGGGKR